MSESPTILEKLQTDTLCPKCGKGQLVVHITNDNIVVREACNACKFSNEVLAEKEKLETAAKSQ